MRVLFVNENIGGHAAMHLYLREALTAHADVVADIVDVPRAAGARRLISTRIPGLAHIDADLQPFRAQLAQSVHVRRRIGPMVDRYDVLHVYTQNAALAITDLVASMPSVVSTDSTNELNAYSLPYREPTRWTGEALRRTRRLEQRVFDAARLVVAQSEWAAQSLRDHYAVEPERLRVIPFGLTVPELPPRRVSPSGLPEITFVGSTMDRKGGWRLLDVYRRHLRGRAILNLVTRDRVGVEAGVRVIDDMYPGDSRLWDLLAGTAVFAFPSEIDKSSYAVLEAMAAGVPVVTSNLAALPELVPDGVAGRLVDPGDDEQLAAALIELLDDDALRTRLGEGARRRVEERFDARVTTAQLVDALRDVGGGRPRTWTSAAVRARHADSNYVAFHARRYVELLGVIDRVAPAPSRVLDIGRSPLTNLLADHLGVPVDTLGFEPDTTTSTGCHYRFDLNDAQDAAAWRGDLPVYDLIVMGEVIEHLHTSPARVLPFLRTLLDDDGVLVVQTPNAAALSARLKLLLGRNPYHLINEDTANPMHFREYTEAELHRYARGAGFDVIDSELRSYFDQRFTFDDDGRPKRPVLARVENVLYDVVPRGLRTGITLVLRPAQASRE